MNENSVSSSGSMPWHCCAKFKSMPSKRSSSSMFDMVFASSAAAGGWFLLIGCGSKACKACCAAMQATISKLQRKHATT